MARNTYILLACSLFLFIACAETTTTGEQTITDSTVNTTPVSDTPGAGSTAPARSTDIVQYIRTSMPGWSVPESSEWEKYWYDRYKKDKNTVYRVQEDFDGNGQGDYAFILKDSSNKYTVWAFLKNDTSYTAHRVYDITRLPKQKLHVGLAQLKAGAYQDLSGLDTLPPKIQTEHPAIHVIFFETASRAYYWKEGSFRMIQTGD